MSRYRRGQMGAGRSLTPDYRSPFAGFKDDVDQPLYHRVVYPAAGQVETLFWNAAGNLLVTNLTTPNRLPGDNDFLIMAIRIALEGALADNSAETPHIDLEKLVRGVFELQIGDNVEYRDFVRNLPGATGVAGALSNGNAAISQALNNGAPDRRAFKPMFTPRIIRAGQTFSSKITLAAGTTVTAGGIGIVLTFDGLYGKDIAPAS